MLPDLWRMVARTVRPVTGAREGVLETGSLRVAEVLAGIAHHRRADAAFHESEAFREGERTMVEALRRVAAPKLALFGHVAWELCLDGALVRRERETLLSDLRDAIALAVDATTGEAAVDAAARIHHAARKAESLPDGFNARLKRFLGELGRGAWVEGYARAEVVAARVEGIRAGLGLGRLDAARGSELVLALERGLADAERAVGAVLVLAI